MYLANQKARRKSARCNGRWLPVLGLCGWVLAVIIGNIPPETKELPAFICARLARFWTKTIAKTDIGWFGRFGSAKKMALESLTPGNKRNRLRGKHTGHFRWVNYFSDALFKRTSPICQFYGAIKRHRKWRVQIYATGVLVVALLTLPYIATIIGLTGFLGTLLTRYAPKK